MADERTYLELSEGDAGSHKFYEVVISGKTLTIRFGRIGDKGQTQVKPFATPAAAAAEASKKLAEKRKKGYAEAVIGERKKRTVTRREGTSQAAAKNVTKAPVIWRFTPKSSRAFGIFIDEARCWMGNEEGAIYSLDHDGRVLDQFKLPDGVKCIVADDQWLYAGCDNGKVYDLGGKVPRVAYEIDEDIDIFWLDIKDGVLGVSDEAGNVAVFNHEDESQWKKKSSGNAGWMVRCDELGVYHGHSEGVTMYDWEDGKKLWHSKTDGSVLFGWQEESMVFAATSSNKVQRFTKRGADPKTYACDAAVFSCAAAEDGKYVFAGDNSSSVYCFTEAGERLWKLNTGCGSAYSMQFFKGRLYVVTTDGSFAAIDASEGAIEAAKAGTVPEAKSIKAPKGKAAEPSAEVETTRTAGDGVIVECYKEGSKARIRPVSTGYNKKWNVQFPKELREVGAKYVVDELRESASGGFYRAHGAIRKLAGG
ncbi:MAG: WGR domain-containing protein [Deltaproteobacteria bacterium]|nr:WGR domain-containing protein [Deltaproteobacteria bacterium]